MQYAWSGWLVQALEDCLPTENIHTPPLYIGFLGSTPLPKCMCIVYMYMHSPGKILVASETQVLVEILSALPWNIWLWIFPGNHLCILNALVASSVDLILEYTKVG